ncbi:Methyltransferase [Candidatus Paraburkholderia calva]|nr:Methyltransferase [Candidatus Paraburkholderia calva]
MWNLRYARVRWVERLDEIVNRHEGDSPRFYTGEWRRAFPHGGFGPLEQMHFAIGHTGTPENVIVDRVRSTSFVAAMPEAAREGIVAEVQALIDGEPELHSKSIVTVPYETAAFVAVRRDA